MIYITGDTHGSIEINRLNMLNFPLQKTLTKDDYVIVLGDFGVIWGGDAEEKYWLDLLNTRKFTLLFIDGNHENFSLLDNYPVSEWNGGKVNFIRPSIIHLMRGQVFNIDNQKFFTFGGAQSIDMNRRTIGKSWWAREMPSHAEYEEGLSNLDKNNYLVDYILTHDCSQSVFEHLMKGLWKKETNAINKYFEVLEEKLDYRQWYFGHYHDDKQIDPKHRLVYQQIIKL